MASSFIFYMIFSSAADISRGEIPNLPEGISQADVLSLLSLVSSVMVVVGLVAGVGVIVGGLIGYWKNRTIGGVVAIFFSVISVFGGAGFLVGLILGVIGGIIIIRRRGS